MRRLTSENINTPELSEKIFKERWREAPHWRDIERFQKMAKHFKEGKCLDVACFNSPMLFEIKLEYPETEVYGIDHAGKVIKKMREYFPEVNYTVGDILKMPYEDKFFDYVMLGETLEHIESPRSLLKECFRVLKHGGWFACSVPDNERRGEEEPTTEHLWGIDIDDIGELLLPYGSLAAGQYKNMILAWCKKI